MAVVTNVTRNAAAGAFFPTMVVLATSGDTINYSQGSNQELALFNTDAAPIVVVVDGSSGTTVAAAGLGDTAISVASGYSISVPAGGYAFVMLDKISSFCQGTVAITAATGAKVKAVVLQ